MGSSRPPRVASVAWKGLLVGRRSIRSAARQCRERGPRVLLLRAAKPTFLPASPAGGALRHWRTQCAPRAPGRPARVRRQGCPAVRENPSSEGRSRSFRSLRPLRLPNLCASSVQEACSPNPYPSMRFVNYQGQFATEQAVSLHPTRHGNDRHPQKRVAGRAPKSDPECAPDPTPGFISAAKESPKQLESPYLHHCCDSVLHEKFCKQLMPLWFSKYRGLSDLGSVMAICSSCQAVAVEMAYGAWRTGLPANHGRYWRRLGRSNGNNSRGRTNLDSIETRGAYKRAMRYRCYNSGGG